MYAWWADLTPLTRLMTSGSFLLASTALWFSGYFWPWGWVVGGILLMLSFPSSSEKRGYRDF